MKYFVIADTHGRYDLVDKARHAIQEQYEVGDKVIYLGDYVDRGPDSRLIIEHLIEAQKLNKNVICLQGNHEAMMLESIQTPLDASWWIGNGGDATLRSYGWGGEPYGLLAYEVVPKAHLEWLKSLPLFFATEKQVFVHAGIPQYDMNLPPKKTYKGERLRQQMQWMLYPKTEAGGWRGKHVVHGHHQLPDGPHVWHGPKGGRTDLDVGAYYTDRLVIGVFDDTQGPAKEFIEVK